MVLRASDLSVAAESRASLTATRVNIEAHNEAARSVLLRIAALAHVSIVIANDVNGTVDLSLHHATSEEAVRAVCAQLNLHYSRDGTTIVVSTASAVVVPLALITAARGAAVVHQLYPALRVREERNANAVVLEGSATEIQSARTVLQGLDIRDATKPTTDAITIKTQSADTVAQRLRGLYPGAVITVVSRTAILVKAIPPDLAQIKTLVTTLDAPTPAPTLPPVASEAVKVMQRRPQDIARAISSQMPHVRVAVAGPAITLSGSPEDVNRAKTLVAALDLPAFDTRFVQIYRLRNVDSTSVAALISKSFLSVQVTVDASLNSISVTATAAEHQRIADGIAQLDGTANNGQNGASIAGAGGGIPSNHEVVQLRSIVPGQAQGASTTAQDVATTVSQALQGSNGDLRITVLNGTQELVLTGGPQSIRAAKALIEELDVVPPSVVLDTEILELDESSSRNLGLQLGTTSIGSTFSEIQPQPDGNGNPGRISAFQALTRTPIQFQAQVNLLVQNGKARVLADPRITTLSGRTATIRAGDTISILTTVGGGTGTVATTQLQSFQTGVTLDITPIITNAGELNVSLHPVVNSLSGYLNSVPQISTRDTQTTVHLRDNETLVIGGLIQESQQRTTSKIPLIGDIPLIGRAFQNDQRTNTRNELIIVVTPHLLSGSATSTIPLSSMAIPTPRPLPTLPPSFVFPKSAPQASRTPGPVPVPAPTLAPQTVINTPPTLIPYAVPTPGVTPSAFAQADVFVYGSPPPNTYAAPGDAPQIYYAMFSPTVLASNSTVKLSVITTTNVQRLSVSAGTTTVSLSPLSPATWQGTFPANSLAIPPTTTSIQLTLTASRGDGQTSIIRIPVSISR